MALGIAEKIAENRARRRASRRGMLLRKSRRRDNHALDYGWYWLDLPDGGTAGPFNTIERVEKWLEGPGDIRVS